MQQGGIMMKILFENSQGKTREIADAATMEEVYKIINEFCEERNFYIHYTRCWSEDDVIAVDVGLHTEFFHIVEGMNA